MTRHLAASRRHIGVTTPADAQFTVPPSVTTVLTDADLTSAFNTLPGGAIIELGANRTYGTAVTSRSFSTPITIRPAAGITAARLGDAVAGNTWTAVSGVRLVDVTFASSFHFVRGGNLVFDGSGTRTDTDGYPIGCDSKTGTLYFTGAVTGMSATGLLLHDNGNNVRGVSINCHDGTAVKHATDFTFSHCRWRDLGGDGNFVVGGDNLLWDQCQMYNLHYTPVRVCTLGAGITSGTTHTSITVTASHAALTAGQIMELGPTGQFVTVSAAVAANATNVPVNSFTANQNYSNGTIVYDDAYKNHADAVQVVAGTGITLRRCHLHHIQQQGLIAKYEAAVLPADKLDLVLMENCLVDHIGGQYVSPVVLSANGGYAGGDAVLLSTVRHVDLVHNTVDLANAKTLMVQYRSGDAASGQTTAQMVWRAVNNSFGPCTYNTVTDSTTVKPALFDHNRRSSTGYGSFTPITGTNEQVTDSPGYAETATYTLAAGSVLINHGATTAGTIVLPTVDFDGNARTGTPDIGAQEF